MGPTERSVFGFACVESGGSARLVVRRTAFLVAIYLICIAQALLPRLSLNCQPLLCVTVYFSRWDVSAEAVLQLARPISPSPVDLGHACASITAEISKMNKMSREAEGKSRSPVTNLVVHATATSGPCSAQGWCASVFPKAGGVSITEFSAAEATTTTATDYSPLAKILHSCVRNKARAEFTTATRAISGRMSGVITP